MGRFNNSFLKNNKGMSLVEMLVVIAIMSICVGGISIGANMVFSKDAERCAERLNDALTQARTVTMSKEGNYDVTITVNSENQYVAIIHGTQSQAQPDGSESSVDVMNETIDLEGDNKKKIESIVADSSDVASAPIKIVFDKTKGNVYSVNGSSSYANGVIEFDISSLHGTGGNKTSKVSLVFNTGKHMVGDINSVITP